MSISEKDLKYIWHPYTQMKNAGAPIAIIKGKGVWLFDESGNKYIDAISSWWVNCHGHSHPHIARKVAEQAKTLEHVIFAGFTHPKAVELAERLLKVLPDNQSKIFYSDNGSTAVEVAIKMAVQFWENSGTHRKGIIAFKNAYHGDTFGAMSVSGRGAFIKPFESMLFDVFFIDPPVKGKEKESLQQLASLIKKNKNEIGAFIYEPLIQAAAGMLMHKPEPLELLLKYCRQNGILLIADEVMTGFGRTGRFFASEFMDTKPDLVCMSKGLTGGTMAMGATSVCTQVYDAFLSDDRQKTFYHGHSFTGNPIASAAACASQDLFERQDTWKNIQNISKRHVEFANSLNDFKMVKEVRTTGTVLAIEINSEESTSYFNAMRDFIYRFFMERRILLRPLGNVIYILPPYCITNSELKKVYAAIIEFLKKG